MLHNGEQKTVLNDVKYGKHLAGKLTLKLPKMTETVFGKNVFEDIKVGLPLQWEEGLMIFRAACHQMGFKMLWLHF